MRLAPRLALAALAGALGLTALAATPAAARAEVSIQYRDRDYSGYRDYRDDRRDWRDHRRDWRGYDNRWEDRREWRDNRRCWPEWRYDYRRDERVRVRYCR